MDIAIAGFKDAGDQARDFVYGRQAFCQLNNILGPEKKILRNLKIMKHVCVSNLFHKSIYCLQITWVFNFDI